MGFLDMMGMDMDSALQMLKKTFKEEKIKSIVLFLDEKEDKVKFEKLEKNILDILRELVTNVPEAHEYFKNKIAK